MTKPLEGVRIIDLSQYLPGPLAIQMLADFGAEVIKVEVLHGELGRMAPPRIDGNRAHYYNVNRNKRSLALDMKDPEGKEVFKRLVEQADVVFEQFRPGTMDRMGLGYEELRKVNKRIVHCALTGYGYSGPLKMAAGHDNNYLALSGILDISGTKESGPVLVGTQIADIAGGTLHSVIAILLALQARELTGEGQFCDVSMTDAACSTMLAYVLADYWGNGKVPAREQDSLNGGTAFYNVYRTSDGKYVTLGAVEPKFWETFCRKMRHEDWIPLRNSPDSSVQEQMKGKLRREFAEKTQREWVEFFSDVDICFAPIIGIDEMVKHPQVIERASVIKEENFLGSGRDAYFPGVPIKLSETPGEAVLSWSGLGADSRVILESLGYGEGDVERLVEKGVIGVPRE